MTVCANVHTSCLVRKVRSCDSELYAHLGLNLHACLFDVIGVDLLACTAVQQRGVLELVVSACL